MASRQEDASALTQASPPWVTQDSPKNFTPRPRKPFTTAREYRKLFIRREVQVFKKQSGQEIQEPRRVVQVINAQGDQELQEEVGQNLRGAFLVQFSGLV